MNAKKVIYSFLFLFFLWLALATRKHAEWFHPFLSKYGGDIFWATMFLFLLRVFFDRIVLWKLSLICFALGVADETLQLYHAPWIEVVRSTRIGGLILGFGFLWSDILCYAAGTLLAFLMIAVIEKNFFKTKFSLQ